jgi:predicted methyltransferase
LFLMLQRWRRLLSAWFRRRRYPYRRPAGRLFLPGLECLEDRSLLSPLLPLAPPALGPALTAAPSPVAVTLSATARTLKDAATLSGGSSPTGTIDFTLYAPGGALVDTETVPVTGDGTYTTLTGYTLPTTGTVAGTYQWDATYSGDGNNATVSDTSDPAEQVTVNKARPALPAGPTTSTVTLGLTAPTLTDTATPAGGYAETGTLTFTLYNPGGLLVDTETATVNGDGRYTTPTGFTLPATGTVAGTYQW